MARGSSPSARRHPRARPEVVPLCPFAAAYIRRHPEYADLVEDDPSSHDCSLPERERGPRRVYANDEIEVHWEPRLCIHTKNCVRLLGDVFDPRRRPWVDVDAADAEAIAATVLTCLTGASTSGGSTRARRRRRLEATFAPQPDGPLVRGHVKVVDATASRSGGHAARPLPLRGVAEQAVLRRQPPAHRLQGLSRCRINADPDSAPRGTARSSRIGVCRRQTGGMRKDVREFIRKLEGGGPHRRAHPRALPRAARRWHAPQGERDALHAALLPRHDPLAPVGDRRAAKARHRRLDAAPEPGHAARRPDRRPRARPRLRQPRLPPRRRRADPLAATRRSAGSRAGSSSAAGAAPASCSPASSPSSSSSTRQRRLPPGTARALCRREDYDRFGEPGASSTKAATSARTSSTRAYTPSASTRPRRNACSTRRGSPTSPTARSCSTRVSRGWRSARSFCAGHPPGMAGDGLGGRATLITPPSLAAVLRAGWTGAVPLLHPTVRAERSSRFEQGSGEPAGRRARDGGRPALLVVERLERAQCAARRAGKTPAASPARKAATARTSNVSQGMLKPDPSRRAPSS